MRVILKRLIDNFVKDANNLEGAQLLVNESDNL